MSPDAGSTVVLAPFVPGFQLCRRADAAALLLPVPEKRLASERRYSAPTGRAVLSTTRRMTKLECTPVTPSMRVILLSSSPW